MGEGAYYRILNVNYYTKKRLYFDLIGILCHYSTMLKKQYRLTNQKAFQATYRIRHSYYKNGIALWVGKKKDFPEIPTKVGFVVSKKTHKRSVKRNRLKRLMRESYRLLLKDNSIEDAQKYLSLIFIGGEKALGKDFVLIKKSIYELLTNIRG